MGGGGSQTVNQRADPWAGIQPFLLGSGSQNFGGGQVYQGGSPNFNEQTGTTNPFYGSMMADSSRPGYDIYGNPLPQQEQQIPQGTPPPQIPGILPEASRLYQDVNPSFFPGSTVAPFTPYQQAAQSLTANRALQGSPVDRAASNQIQQTLGGNYFTNPGTDYLNQFARGDFSFGGPGFDNAYQAAFNRINPAVDSAFSSSGRLNSGLAQAAKTEALGNAFAGLYGQGQQNQLAAANQLGLQFGDERSKQLGALGLAPSIANQDYFDLSQLLNVGGQQQGLNQQNIQEQISRHDFGQNLPFWKLGQYQNFINPILGVGGSSSSTSPLSSNPLAGAVGGGLLGYQAGGLIGGATEGSQAGPYGAAIGALLGALSSR